MGSKQLFQVGVQLIHAQNQRNSFMLENPLGRLPAFADIRLHKLYP